MAWPTAWPTAWANSMLVGMLKGMLNGTLNGTLNGMLNSMLNCMLLGMLNGMLDGMLSSMLSSMLNGMLNGMLNSMLNLWAAFSGSDTNTRQQTSDGASAPEKRPHMRWPGTPYHGPGATRLRQLGRGRWFRRASHGSSGATEIQSLKPAPGSQKAT